MCARTMRTESGDCLNVTAYALQRCSHRALPLPVGLEHRDEPARFISRRTLDPEADCVGVHTELLGDAADRSRLADLGDHAHGPLAHLLRELGTSGHSLLLNLGASTLTGTCSVVFVRREHGLPWRRAARLGR